MDSETYPDQKDRQKTEQEGMTKAEVAAEMEKYSEYVQDLDNMPKNDHMWVKRGLKEVEMKPPLVLITSLLI